MSQAEKLSHVFRASLSVGQCLLHSVAASFARSALLFFYLSLVVCLPSIFLSPLLSLFVSRSPSNVHALVQENVNNVILIQINV